MYDISNNDIPSITIIIVGALVGMVLLYLLLDKDNDKAIGYIIKLLSAATPNSSAASAPTVSTDDKHISNFLKIFSIIILIIITFSPILGLTYIIQSFTNPANTAILMIGCSILVFLLYYFSRCIQTATSNSVMPVNVDPALQAEAAFRLITDELKVNLLSKKGLFVAMLFFAVLITLTIIGMIDTTSTAGNICIMFSASIGLLLLFFHITNNMCKKPMSIFILILILSILYMFLISQTPALVIFGGICYIILLSLCFFILFASLIPQFKTARTLICKYTDKVIFACDSMELARREAKAAKDAARITVSTPSSREAAAARQREIEQRIEGRAEVERAAAAKKAQGGRGRREKKISKKKKLKTK